MDESNVREVTDKMANILMNWLEQVYDKHIFRLIDPDIFKYDEEEYNELVPELKVLILGCTAKLIEKKLDVFGGRINLDVLQMLGVVCIVIAAKSILQYDWYWRTSDLYVSMAKLMASSDVEEDVVKMKMMEGDILRTVDWKPCESVLHLL
jgi:hypothetical protein